MKSEGEGRPMQSEGEGKAETGEKAENTTYKHRYLMGEREKERGRDSESAVNKGRPLGGLQAYSQ